MAIDEKLISYYKVSKWIKVPEIATCNFYRLIKLIIIATYYKLSWNSNLIIS